MQVNNTLSESPARGFAEQVVAEIRAEMGRQQVRYVRLAERLGENEVWVSRKVRGLTPLTMTDLERIATALDVEVADLLPTSTRRRINKTSSPPAVRTSGPRSQRALLAPGHATGRHPTGRPASAMSGTTPAELRRPAITGHTHSGSST
jgi:transcriptional regulator with XRE-family HTH domain